MQDSFFAPSSQVGGRWVDGGWSDGEAEEKVEQQVRKLELEAYAAVVRAFGAQSEVLTWAKERLMSDLRKELRVTEEQHRLIVCEVDDALREYRPSSRMLAATGASGAAAADGNLNGGGGGGSQSRKKQKTELLSVESPFVVETAGGAAGASKRGSGGGGGGAPRAKKSATTPKATTTTTTAAHHHHQAGVGFDVPVDNWLGRRVKTRWPEDKCFYEAVITRYDRERGMHALVYDMDTPDETWEWVNLKDMNKNDLLWVDAPRVPLAGKRIPPEEGAGMGRDSVSSQGGGMKWQETAGGVLSALLGKQKNGQRGQTAISSPQHQQAARAWASNAPPPPPLPHLDIALASRKGGSNSVVIPDFAPFMKEADALDQEESMEKLEHIKKMASEHEVILRRALADVGESEDDSDT